MVCMLVVTVCVCFILKVFFFFKQKTAYEMRISDWSSDVCSSDLLDTIVQSLTLHGYELADDPQIWCLHMQAQLREINGGRCRSVDGFEFRPLDRKSVV